MNLAAANYESQIGVEFKLEYYVKRCKGLVCAPGHQYTNTNANALLDEFRTRWESGWLASKRRGAVHLLTGKNIDGSVIGMAYKDVMCDSIPGDAWNGKYEYGISVATQPSLGCNVGLVMSELGHNAGSNHFLGCSNTFPRAPSARSRTTWMDTCRTTAGRTGAGARRCSTGRAAGPGGGSSPGRTGGRSSP